MPKVTVVYENKTKGELHSGWGFSCLVEEGSTKVLFDTGWDGQVLLENLELLQIDPKTINVLVLSHQHWDHIGGLSHVLHAAESLKVYVPSSLSRHLRKEISRHSKVVEVTDSCEIAPGIWSSGELGKKTPEQSLIVKGKNGIFVITGCAHPGLQPILEVATSFGEVVGILGGLHSLDEIQLLEDMDYIAAGHCTKRMEELKSLCGSRNTPIHSGYSIDL